MTTKNGGAPGVGRAWLAAGLILAAAAAPGTALAQQNPFPPAAPAAPQNPFPPATAPAAPQNPFPPAAGAPAPPQNPAPQPSPQAAAPAPQANPFPQAAAPAPQPYQPTQPPPPQPYQPTQPAAPPQAGAAAPPPGAAQPMSLQQFFVGGHWRSVVPGPQGTEITDFQFRPDGSFAELDRYIPRGGQPINVVFTGRWAVQPLQGATVELQLQPQHAYPPQICGANGACQTVPLRPAQYQVTLTGRNAIQYGGHIIKRVP